MRCDFYGVVSIEKTLIGLLTKIFQEGQRAVVWLPTDRIEDINQLLWIEPAHSFLPHGSDKDGNLDKQPIALTAHEGNPNNAQCLVFVQADTLPTDEAFERIAYVFPIQSTGAQAKAQQLKEEAEKAGHTTFLWTQDSAGRWNK